MTDNGWGGSYWQLAVVLTEEEIITRKIMIGQACLAATNVGCRAFAKQALATIYLAVSLGGKLACFAIVQATVLSNLPPDVVEICDVLAEGGPLVKMMLDRLEKPIYESCFKTALPECLKAAAASG